MSGRTWALPFVCPRCGRENRSPRVGRTEGGTDIVLCDDCPQEVSARLVADHLLARAAEREAAIMRWAGWA